MGYTHYWKFKQNPKDINDGEKKFNKAVALLKKCIAKIPTELDHPYYGKCKFKLAGGLGTGEPVFDNDKVCFNGVEGNPDLSHETCQILLDNPDDYDFDFCKTAEKPYDVAVCLALLSFKKEFGRDFSYSSDGDKMKDYGWKLANDIMDSVIWKI